MCFTIETENNDNCEFISTTDFFKKKSNKKSKKTNVQSKKREKSSNLNGYCSDLGDNFTITFS